MSQQPSFAIQLINKFGFNDASTILYDMVFRTFNADSQRALLSQMKQFVREEFDAASQARGYASDFVKRVCPNSNWYRGAMGETPRYPIDGDGGPQQTILAIVLPVIHENPELGIKLRCRIVEKIYNDYHELSLAMGIIPDEAYEEVREAFDALRNLRW